MKRFKYNWINEFNYSSLVWKLKVYVPRNKLYQISYNCYKTLHDEKNTWESKIKAFGGQF